MVPMLPVNERDQLGRNRCLKSHDDLGLATSTPPTNRKNRNKTLMSRLRCLQRHTLALALLVGLALMVAGCRMAAPPPVRENIHSADSLVRSRQQMRLRIRVLVEPSRQHREIRGPDPCWNHQPRLSDAKRLWKIEAVPALREALFQTESLRRHRRHLGADLANDRLLRKGPREAGAGRCLSDRGGDLQVPGRRACRRGRIHHALRRCFPCPNSLCNGPQSTLSGIPLPLGNQR